MIQATKPFPIASFRNEPNEKPFLFCRNRCLNESYPPHVHDYFEIEIVVSGKAEQSLNGIPFQIGRGHAHILSTTDVHDLTIIEPIDIFKIMIYPDQGNELITNEIINNLGVVKFDENELSEIIALTDMLINEGNMNKRNSLAMIHHLLNCLIIKFSRKEKFNTQTTSNLHNKYIKSAVNYIILNYVNDISPIDIANHLNISSAYFSTLFHNLMGTTAVDYITNLRLKRAYTMLSMGSYTVSEACYACGFNSPSNFLRAFRSKYGISPNELKKSAISHAEQAYPTL